VRTKRPSNLPVVVAIVVLMGLMGWVQNDDQAALERERATIKQLAREKAGFGCADLPTSGESK